MYVYVYVCICVCSNIFSETTWPIVAKFHVEPPWDKGRKFIQMVQVICCSSLLSTSGDGGGGGARTFSRDFTINLSLQCRTFSRALKTETLKAPLFPGPVGAGTTNDWCIISTVVYNGVTMWALVLLAARTVLYIQLLILARLSS